MIPVTHFYALHGLSDRVRQGIFADFADAGGKHIVLTDHCVAQIMTDTAFAKKLMAETKAAGVSFLDAHAPFGILSDLCLPIDEYRRLMLTRTKYAIEIANLFGLDTITVHVGSGMPVYEGKTDVKLLCDYPRRSLEELLPVAEKNGVVMCIENIWSPITTAERLLEFIDYFKSPWLGICYDAGHAHIASKPREVPNNADKCWGAFGLPVGWDEQTLEKLLPEIVNCHLHDNHGLVDEHFLPGKGLIDWKHVMGLLKKAPKIRLIQNEANDGGIAERVHCYEKLMEM